MGIPFYFVSLIRSHRGITKQVTRIEVDVVGFDFNCLIHRYLKDEDPVNSVIKAIEYILTTVVIAKKVIIAFDGIVPYAKIVQQRFRRMRSKDEGVFDRNQISPETIFMRELENAVAARFPSAVLSRTNTAGEGEHKLVLELQKLGASHRKSVCIYGLDADLILICLQNKNLSEPGKMHLLRESSEFNDPLVNTAEFATLDIHALSSKLPIQIDQYIALSMLCFGNDFMPNLGIFSLREEGYDRALDFYTKSGKPNLLIPEGRHIFLKYAASKELTVLRQRIEKRNKPEEKAVIGKSDLTVSRKYGLHILEGVYDMKKPVEAFWKTFHWSMFYFKNSTPINWHWYYPYPDAPLISDIVHYSETLIETGRLNYTVADQLHFIMPGASLRRTRRKVKYVDEIHDETRHPWMKRHDWEMKPRISLPWNPTCQMTSVVLL
jgi:5'-3' exonuclease